MKKTILALLTAVVISAAISKRGAERLMRLLDTEEEENG